MTGSPLPRLDDRVALVTGGSRGLGAAIFAFCGRYTELAARLSLEQGVDPNSGDAPSVRLDR